MALCIVLTFMGCGDDAQNVTALTTEPVAEESTTTEAAAEGPGSAFEPYQEFEVEKGELNDFLDHWVEQYGLLDQAPSCRITVTGMCTPVTLELEGVIVKNMMAYGRTLVVDADTPEGLTEFSLSQWQDTLIVNKEEECWLMTREKDFYFPCEDGVITGLWTNEEGQLRYTKTAQAAYYMEQWVTAPLDSATDRGNLYSEWGFVQLRDGQPVLIMEERTLMGHKYDFDTLFIMARTLGWGDYEGCETADDVLRSNKEKGDTWLTYPYEPKEPVQRVEFKGLILQLHDPFEEELLEDGTMVLRKESMVDSIVLKVTTGEAADGYQGLKDPITAPEQMVDWDSQNQDGENVFSFTVHDVPCLYVCNDEIENIRGYYFSGDRWWVIEVENTFTEWLPTYATCGVTAN